MSSNWYYKVTKDIANLVPCIEHFEKELEQAKFELSLKGKTIEKHAAELPGILETRFSQLQEAEAILEFLNLQLTRKRSQVFKRFLENYQRALSSRDCEKYADGDPEVYDLSMLVNEFALVRNRYLSVIKGLDAKNFMLGHISKLRVSGFEDSKID